MIDWNFTEGFHPKSKVWIYQCNRTLTETETATIESALNKFAKVWISHNEKLKAIGKVLLNRFLILIVDESLNVAGGCSIDSSVKFIREVETEFQISLLDRTLLLFEENEILKEVLLIELNETISKNEIHPNTFYFDNTVTVLDELKNKWKIEIKNSWIASRFKSELLKIE